MFIDLFISNDIFLVTSFTGINQNAVAPDNTKVRADMEAAVKEFYKSFSVTYEELRRKCKAELIQLAKLKRQAGKSLISNNTAWESDA